MAPQVEISIPNTTVSNAPKPYTLYNITLRLPLRSFTVKKRYSDFTALNEEVTSQVGAAPPAPIPQKSWFSSTTSNPKLAEERRKGLEEYLQAINNSDDSRWRSCSAWRAFLNLPSTTMSNSSGKAAGLYSTLTEPGAGGAPITDPTVWLDCHRDVKSQLHDARLHLTRRDQASTPQKQHEASAQAKSCLVKAGTMINALERGLKNLSEDSGWGSNKLGDGELRRRKDLIASAKKEREGLENLQSAMAAKSQLDATVAMATAQNKQTLLGDSASHNKPIKSGRVLGKETNQTRELDNQGVLQLQKQIIKDQDLDVEELRKVVMRQKELGIQINEELEVQNEMLKMVDEDVDRSVFWNYDSVRKEQVLIWDCTGFNGRWTLRRRESGRSRRCGMRLRFTVLELPPHGKWRLAYQLVYIYDWSYPPSQIGAILATVSVDCFQPEELVWRLLL
jgi:regulator of vacuolar morphogenesis